MTKPKTQHNWGQVIAYYISGGAFFVSGYVWFFVAYHELGWTLWWAKLSANILGLAVNFLLQHYWVFKTHTSAEKTTKVTGRYIAVSGLNFVLDYYIVRGLQSQGITPYLGQFGSSAFFTVWNYFWYKHWVFVHRDS